MFARSNAVVVVVVVVVEMPAANADPWEDEGFAFLANLGPYRVVGP